MTGDNQELRLFLVAGEHSGDQLAGPLISAIRSMTTRDLKLSGVGGDAMAAEGCSSLFPLSDIAVMGPIAILKRLPSLISRVHQTVDAAVEMSPHALVILDSPEFTHPVAKRVRKRLPDIPVIDYVSPSVWAWRPGRARKMTQYVDHVLAILPFEPAAHKRLGGPACSYVGHPLIERLDWITSRDGEALRKRLGIAAGKPVLAVLPGSRTNEINRLMEVYGETVSLLTQKGIDAEILIPVASGTQALVRSHLENWQKSVHILEGEDDKFAAFRLCDAALATSGTVTLELALAGAPMVVGYKADIIVKMFTNIVLKAHSFVLPNLVLGENVFPEFIHDAVNPDTLTSALLPLFDKASPELKKQNDALKRIAELMQLDTGTPSERSAKIILDCVQG